MRTSITDGVDVRSIARKHLLPHFTRGGVWASDELPVIVSGDGIYVSDDRGNRFMDGVSSLYCVNIGHGRADFAAAAAKQMETLGYWNTWSAVHPTAAEAACLIAGLAPGDLETVFFVNSGSEANESAVKLARQYHISQGQPQRTKILARDMAYHGTTLGALAITGISKYQAPFTPMLMPGVHRFPNTLGETVPAGGAAADLPSIKALNDVIEREGGDTFAALFAEPVQNSRGALVPPEGYWAELRAICDRHGILLVADEVITGFGRTGGWFGTQRYGVVPDLLTFAKGVTSGYAPLGGVVIREHIAHSIMESPLTGQFLHGATWGGHPVSCAVAVANISAMRDEGVVTNVVDNEDFLRAALEDLVTSHSSVLEVRGAGYFYTFEIVGDRATGRPLTDAQSIDLLREVMPKTALSVGLLTRVDDRGATMLQLAPPLIADRAQLDEYVRRLDQVLSAVDEYLHA